MTKEIVQAIATQEVQRELRLQSLQASYETSDATPVTILTIEIPEYSAGHLEVDVVALLEDGSDKYTSKAIVGFRKDTVLVLDLADFPHDENGIAASFDVINDSENAAIELTGVAATVIKWKVRVPEPFLLTIEPPAAP
jgi:hypothetical protein